MVLSDEWSADVDVSFLFAQEHELEDALSHVCELLAEPSGATAPSPIESQQTSDPRTLSNVAERRPKKPPPNPHSSRARQLREMQHLRTQVLELKTHLRSLQTSHSSRVRPMSTWEGAARQQLHEKNLALQDNAQLREQVIEQATFLDELKEVLRKKPRLAMMDMASQAWQDCKLAAHASLRAAAMRAIADRQLALMQTAFLRAGLFDYTGSDFMSMAPSATAQLSDRLVTTEYVYHFTIPASYRALSASLWDIFKGGVGAPPSPSGASEVFHVLDDYTVYRTYEQIRQGAIVHSNFVRRYYPSQDHDVVLWRSVLDDALMPQMRLGAVNDECGWLRVKPAPGGAKCYLQAVLQIVDTDGRSPPAQYVVTDNCWDAIDHSSVLAITPDRSVSMQTFLERGRALELAVKDAVEAVVFLTAPVGTTTRCCP